MTNASDLRAYAYVLAVPDLARSADYFQSVLGFSTDWQDGDNWRALSRGSVRVMLGHCPDALPPSQTGDHSYFAYFHVDDIDALHAELAPRGAIILQPPADKPWGMREMALATPDGHRMMVGQVLD
jgi:catechol 2,3-dioxygenase-like lactoylglutathione lyase family enzyme